MNILGLIDIPDFLVLLGIALTAYYMFLIKKHDIFKMMGVPGPKPLPYVGNHALFKMGADERYRYLRETYGKVYGVFMGTSPLLVLGDIDLVQQVTIKDFSIFKNRLNQTGAAQVPPMSRIVFFLCDDDWKRVRNILSPTFTTGRIKQMLQAMNTTSKTLVACIKPNADRNGTINIKEISAAYSMDTIASVAFGVDVNCQRNPNDTFVKNARILHAGDPKKKYYPVGTLVSLFPFISPVVKQITMLMGYKSTFANDATLRFFEQIINETIALRQSLSEKPIDFLQLLMDADGSADDETSAEDDATVIKPSSLRSSRPKQKLTRDELVAQCVLFFLAGHDTTATTLMFSLFNLAQNPDVQERVLEEINKHIGKDVVPDYEMLGQMQYLEMVIMETLRLYPVTPVVNRECSRDVRIGPYFLPKGIHVSIPIWQIHHDPEIWESPEMFNPDRFQAEARAKHHPAQWMPFGIGPRQCVGTRLAMLELKVALVHVLREFTFKPSDMSKLPIKFSPFDFLFITTTPMYLQVENRVK